MRNDPPSNLRMGFGFQEAVASGAPFIAPRSAKAINEDLRQIQASKPLKALCIDPKNRARIREMVNAGKSISEIKAAFEISN